jgi:GTPase SAR1 family protein
MSRTRIVTVFGSPSVGKSKLTDRLIDKKFDENYVPTIERRKFFRFFSSFFFS